MFEEYAASANACNSAKVIEDFNPSEVASAVESPILDRIGPEITWFKLTKFVSEYASVARLCPPS